MRSCFFSNYTFVHKNNKIDLTAKWTYQMKWVWTLTKGYRSALGLFFILELVVIILSLLFIYWSKNAIDFAVTQSSNEVKKMLFLSVLAVVLGLSLRTYSRWLNENTKIALLAFLQKQVLRVQMLSKWETNRKWQTGDIQVRIHSDCQDVIQMVGNTAISSVLTMIRLVASFGFLWVMDPMLGLMILAISPLLFFSKMYFRVLRKINQDLKNSESSFGHVLLENLRFRNSIRALGLYEGRWQRVEEGQEEIILLKNRLLNFSTGSQALMKLAVNAGFLLTFIWGVYRLYTEEITFGTMTAFLQLVGRVQTPILALMAFVPQFIRFRTSLGRVVESLDTEIEADCTPQYFLAPESIQLEQVRFKYDDVYVLDGVNTEFLRGEAVAVLGPSGRGKTTLIRLLLALMEPNLGNVWIKDHGRSYKLTPAHRVNIAYVPQGDNLFSGTIRDNLQLNNKELSEQEIGQALHLACGEFVYGLPEGVDTYIGESGYGLSEGQAQRIAVARAMVRDCGIWLFDEVTSALDKETAERMIKRLMVAGRNKIMVFVTHDRNLATMCQKTIYI